MKTWNRTFLPLLVLSSFSACSDSSSETNGKPVLASDRNDKPNETIKAYILEGKDKRLVEFAPVSEEATKTYSSLNKDKVGINTQFVVQDPKSGTAVDVPFVDPSHKNAWGIVEAAANVCGFKDRGGFMDKISVVTTPPWTENAFYIYNGELISSCDIALALEENMLCVANKMSEVAETVSGLLWRVELGDNSFDLFIPPQAEKDKFIARDLAINALASLAMLENMDTRVMVRAGEGETAGTCVDLYNQATLEGGLAQNGLALFGTALNGDGHFPDDYHFRPLLPVNETTISAIVEARHQFRANVLRASGRLLHDLIRKSVFSDLASAEKKRARSTDPLLGNQRAWGLDLPGPWNGKTSNDYAPGYGTVEHAIRVLAGRWELGTPLPESPQADEFSHLDPWGDPKCGGVRSINLLRQAYGPDASARINDVGLNTRNQNDAATILLKLGIVIHPSEYGEDELNASVRAAVLDFYKEYTAWNHGFRQNDAPDVIALVSSGQHKAIESSISQISDEDLRYALHRNYDLFRLHGSVDESETVSTYHKAGLKGHEFEGTSALNSIEQLGGAVFSNLSELNLGGDITARAGGILEANQCNGDYVPPGSEGAWDSLNGRFFRLTPFQDSFSLGQMLYQRAVILREATKQLSVTNIEQGYPDSVNRSWLKSGTVEVADATAAEIRTWAGPGYMTATRSSSGLGSVPTQSLVVTLVGFRPEDIGVSQSSQMADRLGVVYGEAWVAECMAGQRATCPSDIADYRGRPEFSTVENINNTTIVPNAPSYFGADDYIVRLIFNAEEFSDKFSPQWYDLGDKNSSGKRLYVVTRGTTSSPGRILGTLALHNAPVLPITQGGEVTYENGSLQTRTPVSFMQGELLNDVLGLASKSRPTGSTPGNTRLSSSRSYCLDGATLDKFVPLENELTSDSDQYETSWRHYLTLAKAAAEEADRLGEQLIQLGLQRDMRREQALEAIGDQCGVYAEAENLSVKNGQPKAPPENSKIANCISSDNYDVVFLSKGEISEAEAREYLGCSNPVTDADHPKCQKNSLQVSTFELAESKPPTPSLMNASCQDMANAIAAMPSGIPSDPFIFAASAGDSKYWLDNAHIKSNVAQLHMFVGEDGHWKLTMAGVPVMDSVSDNIWPGCLADGGECANQGAQAVYFNQVFRANATASSPGLNGTCTPGSQRKYVVGSDGHENTFCLDTIKEGENFLIPWRVQSALWFMASAAGAVPKGMFEVAIPVADLSKSGWSPPPSLAVVYGDGILTDRTVGGVPYRVLNDANNSVAESIRLSDPPSSVLVEANGWTKPPSSEEIPTWLKNLGQDTSFSNKYRMLRVSNPEIPLNGGFNIQINRVDVFNNAVCSSFAGQPSNSTPTEHFFDWSHEVAQWKLINPFTPPPFESIANQGQVVFPLSSFMHLSSSVKKTPGDVLSPNDFKIFFANVFTSPPTLPIATNIGSVYGFAPATPTLGSLSNPSIQFPIYSVGFDSRSLDPIAASLSGHPFSTSFFSQDCEPSVDAMPSIDTSCVADRKTDNTNIANFDTFRGVRYALEPSKSPPEGRLPLFINVYPPAGGCGAIAQVTQFLALSCAIGTGGFTGPVNTPPEIRSEADMLALELWLETIAHRVDVGVAKLYMEDVPKGLVADVKGSNVSHPEMGGQQREIYQSLGKAINGVPGTWGKISATLRAMKYSIALSRGEIVMAKLQLKEKEVNLVIQKLGIVKDIVDRAEKGISAWFGALSSPVKAATALSQSLASTVNIGADYLILENLEELKGIAEEQQQQQVNSSMLKLSLSVSDQSTSLDQLFREIQNQTRDIISLTGQLKENQQKAKYELAKATGASYVLDEDGKPIATFPVNQVLNRQYDLTKKRYENALKHAKYIAFMARLAVEQRLGKRLGSFTQNVGPLEAPATWADDICSFQGIDYQKLREVVIPPSPEGASGAGGATNEGGSGGENQGGSEGEQDPKKLSTQELLRSIFEDHTDQYVGDYVRKLEQFVEYYNIEYPSHDGDDQIVISLRDDLIKKPDMCLYDSRNQLYFSGHLERNAYTSDDGSQSLLRGWQVTECVPGQTRCLVTSEGTSVLKAEYSMTGNTFDPALDKSLKVAFENTTWLHDLAGASGTETEDSSLPPILQKNPASVWQKIHLVPGHYVLSWQDQARLPSGEPVTGLTSTATLPYRLGIFDQAGVPIRAVAPVPFSPTAMTPAEASLQWSERYEEAFIIDTEEDYYVLVGASPGAGNSLGSVIIKQMQLELSENAKASTYQDVLHDRHIVYQKCSATSSSDLRDAFVHGCEGGACFYELKEPLFIETDRNRSSGGTPGSSLQGKLAVGNFNYRHVSLGVNMAGTGLVDCAKDPNPSCYGNGFLEYTLHHDAFSTSILGYDEKTENFNFGSAGINHGKALAAERYITLPLSSADASFLAQPSIEKVEFRGRPLDGSYRLRIWDRPGLVWSHLDDIQIVLRYRYWSTITTQPKD